MTAPKRITLSDGSEWGLYAPVDDPYPWYFIDHHGTRNIGHSRPTLLGSKRLTADAHRKISDLLAPPAPSPTITEKYEGVWNNWLAPLHACAFCARSLNWEQHDPEISSPYISAMCECGCRYSAVIAWPHELPVKPLAAV